MSVLQSLRNSIAKKKLELQQLELAYSIIQQMEHGAINADDPDSTPVERSAPSPAPLQAEAIEQTVAPAPTPKPVYQGPRCGACGNKMYQTYRTMPSGAVVNLLKCNDNACGNEAYQ